MKIQGNIIAHRGIFDNEKVPENSIKAFQKAIDNHLPIELDVQLTKDNVLVVFHDDTLDRMTHQTGILQEKTYEELKNYTLLDTQEKIPTFEEVLKLVQQKVFLDIEVKDTKRIQKTCEVLLNLLNHYSNFVVKSFHPKIIRTIKKLDSNVETGLLIPKRYNCSYFLNMILKSRWMLFYAKPDFIAIHKSLLKKKKYQRYALKYPTMIWTIKNSQDIDQESNYIYICNNLPFSQKKESH